MDFILLFLLKKINKNSSNAFRMLIAAAFGAMMACIVGICYWMNDVIKFFLMYIVSSMLMVLIAFGKRKKVDLLKQVIVLYIITYFIGGFMNSIYYYTNLRYHLVRLGEGILYSDISWKVVIITILILTPVILYVIGFLRWFRDIADQTVQVELVMENKSIYTKGLMDTGNCLYDPVNKRPVMVIENTLMDDLLSSEFKEDVEEAKQYIQKDDASSSELNIKPEHLLRLRFVPYQSIGKKQGILIGLILDKVIIHTGKETICNEKVTAAICDNKLSSKEEYHVILHKELL